MPTLQDVARRAGVSTATVSKVLSNTPYFSEETRERVLRAVEDLGYVPHLAARALAAGKTQIIAVVFPYLYEPIFKDPLVMLTLEGVEAECTQRGYNLLLSTPRFADGGLEAHYIQLIRSGYMDGVIAIDNVPVASVLPPVNEKGIVAVSTGYHAAGYYVRSDDYRGGRLLMQHLLGLGHRCIGVINVPANANLAVNRRIDGCRDVAQSAGIDFDAFPVAYGDYSTASGVKAAQTLLQQHPRLTALLCINDRMAIGAMQHARQIGRMVPDDLTVVGYDDIPAADRCAPSLTTVNQKALEVGRMAAIMLFDILSGQPPDSRVVPAELIVRDSSAAIV